MTEGMTVDTERGSTKGEKLENVCVCESERGRVRLMVVVEEEGRRHIHTHTQPAASCVINYTTLSLAVSFTSAVMCGSLSAPHPTTPPQPPPPPQPVLPDVLLMWRRGRGWSNEINS